MDVKLLERHDEEPSVSALFMPGREAAGKKMEKKNKKKLYLLLPSEAFLIQPQSMKEGISSHQARVNEYQTLWERHSWLELSGHHCKAGRLKLTHYINYIIC